MSNDQWNQGQGNQWAPDQGGNWGQQPEAQQEGATWGQQPQSSANEWTAGQDQQAQQQWDQQPQASANEWNQQPQASANEWNQQPQASANEWATGQDQQAQQWNQQPGQWQGGAAGYQGGPVGKPNSGSGLFSLDFTKFSLPQSGKLVWLIGIVVIGITWLFEFIGVLTGDVNSLGMLFSTGDDPSAMMILNALIVGLAKAALEIVLLRVIIEGVIALIKIAEKPSDNQ